MRRMPNTVALVAFMAIVSAACLSSGSPDEDVTRLEDLGTRWLDTPATVTYRTLEREAGEATSTHQCLRQYADRATDIHRLEAIRICSGEGTLRFIQDPPRWRMEVSTPTTSFTIISAPEGTFRCGLDADGPSTCSAIDVLQTPFEPLLLDPDQILGSSALQVGDVLRTEDRLIAGVEAECFSAGSRDAGGEHVEWCYSSSGVLLSFTAITGLSSFSTVEATEVSLSVPAEAFALP